MSTEWDGTGLPPVGTLCQITAHNNRWGFLGGASYKGVVVAYSGDDFWFKDANGTHTVSRTDKVDFHPIRTEAERKREESTEAMNIAWRARAGEEHDGKLKSIYEIIYDAIAAGKIPGIRLTDDAGS